MASAPTKPRRAVPKVTYLSRTGKKLGRPSEDQITYSWLTDEWQTIKQIEERLFGPEVSKPNGGHSTRWLAMQTKLFRLMKRQPGKVEKLRGKGFRRRST